MNNDKLKISQLNNKKNHFGFDLESDNYYYSSFLKVEDNDTDSNEEHWWDVENRDSLKKKKQK